MASKLFPSLAAAAFGAILSIIFLKRRSSEINGGEANDDEATNDGTARGASSTHSSEGREMATSSGYDYEVFLSFRGPDTRADFTDFLYVSLVEAGIRTYKDDEELSAGEEIGSTLLEAINQSKILIPIFSKSYASSVWCLKELVQMVECQKTGRQKIMPIFYDVAPSEVRYQTGDYKRAFRSHERRKRNDKETVHKWKTALSAVGAIKGWDLHNMPNRRDGQFAKALAEKLLNDLKKAFLVVPKYLVSVDQHVDKIMEMIAAQTNETRILGIHGMGGTGKTTIAKIIYNQLADNFEDYFFLSNISKMSKLKGIECLQNHLISDVLKKKCTDIRNIDDGIKIIRGRLSNKRVLLLLDDVDEKNHMNVLVGERDWFGIGSKIIITTRRKDLLDVLKVDCTYEVNGMDPNQSLQLFSKHAFKRDYPLDEYMNQSKRAINIAGGLPLALEVIGSLLSHTEKERWDCTLKKLENVPDAEVQRTLRTSFDALDFRQKLIFLDIACLFIGYDKDIVVNFWDPTKFPEEALEVLQKMSLIKIEENNEVWMHNQLRDFGREMIRQESEAQIEEQSRVWNYEEALCLLKSHKEKKKVEALLLKFDNEHCLTYEDFANLSNLKFLKVDGVVGNFHAQRRRLWHNLLSNVLPTYIFQENSELLPQLKWLSWQNIPPNFNITNFSMENMVILDLSWSEIRHDWKGWSHMKVIKNLKVLNLTSCHCLERTPNLSDHANLERLILRSCSKLVEIDGKICRLTRLVSLDVRCCKSLQRLPDELGGLKALKELLIDFTSIEEFPNFSRMKNLRIVSATTCPINTLPLSTGELATLKYLSLDSCRSLKMLPDSIGNLNSLIELDISWTSIEELPGSIGNLNNLKVVKMTGSPISKIPDTLWTIENLEHIEAENTPRLQVKIGNGIYRSPSLRILKLGSKIFAVPRLPESLISLHLSTLHMKTFPDLANLINLKELYMRFGPHACDGYELGEDQMPRWIGKLSKLEFLDLFSASMTTLPTDIILLPKLKTLKLSCPNLCRLPRLPSSLLNLHLDDCESLCLMDLSNLKKLSSLTIWSSPISEFPGLDCLEDLQYLDISRLGQVKRLPDLRNLNKLKSVQVQNCGNLVEIQGVLPQFLEKLEIHSCESLQNLPDPSSFKRLQKIKIENCMKLNMEDIPGFAQRRWQISRRSQRWSAYCS